MPKKRETEKDRVKRYFDEVLLIITQEKLAHEIGVSVKTIGNNKKDISSMKMATFFKLAKFRDAHALEIAMAPPKIKEGAK